MSSANRNFVVAYILLVGIPLLGLVGVLKSGRTLAAPISVDGVWRLETSAGPESRLPCAKGLASFSSSTVQISQSGKSLVLTVNDGSRATARGAIEGKTIKASFVPRDSAGGAGCNSDAILSLTATLDPKSDPRTMSGALSMDGCASCAPVEFRAARQPRTSGGGTH